jgi:hypothetical protein
VGKKNELKNEVEQRVLANSPNNLAGTSINEIYEGEEQLFGEQS